MKRIHINISITLVLSVFLMLTACEKGFDEFNANPNAPGDAAPAFVLPGAQVDLSYYTSYQIGINYIGLWVQQHASGAYPEEDQYSPRLNDFNVFWNNILDNGMKDFQHIINNGTPNQVAVAMTLRSYGFMMLTDIWGDIPYSQALKGEEGGEFLTPVFDTQEAVYDGIISDLAAAVAMMDQNAIDGFGAEDLVYGGDMALWEKFANSLRLRAFMHLSEVNAAKAQAGVVEMLGKSLIANNSENAAMHYIDGNGNRNPLHSRFAARPNDFRMSKSMMDRLIGSGDTINPSDPRTAVYAERNSNGIYVGIPNGINGLGDVGLNNATSCQFGAAILAPDAPSNFITYAEVEFIRAEAAIRGWIADDKKTAYDDAIKASMDEWGITDAAVISAFLDDPLVVYNDTDAMKLVSTQKWVAMFNQSVESWTNFRRTGYPELPIALNDQNNGQFPVRFPYGSVEAATNATNVQTATDRQGGAELSNPVWWDK